MKNIVICDTGVITRYLEGDVKIQKTIENTIGLVVIDHKDKNFETYGEAIGEGGSAEPKQFTTIIIVCKRKTLISPRNHC